MSAAAVPTNSSFGLVHLGTFADLTPSNNATSDAKITGLLGSYGSAKSPLYLQQFTGFSTDGNDDISTPGEEKALDIKNTMTLNIRGSEVVYDIRATLGFEATITYVDLTQETGAVGTIQDNAGNVWLIPSSSAASFNKKPLQSICLDRVLRDPSQKPAAQEAPGTEYVSFAAGTLIETPDGPRRIETLQCGDLVMTLDNGPQPLKWRGQRYLDFSSGARMSQKPIEIKAGALSHDLPKRPLVVSPRHRALLKHNGDEVLVPAKALLRRAGIRVRRGHKDVTYHSLALERHEVIFAEGVAVESLCLSPRAMALLSPVQRLEISCQMPQLFNGKTYEKMMRDTLSSKDILAGQIQPISVGLM